ncbi:hypothetical protein N7462_008558 [Penicillium macrosclerotiorum]|uniref:uncharacterized protein n=1 Tax=Penicillium macrosclerotiorum TaxID=303699 RepID=UPI002548909F|nr:uncharacterized protein N7462_008558 [Penicillium macrosclerotiorum]KAJ5675661.1 hypothetical protein N7462_008558 [Penicillium macrosclerotiorum]
MVAWDGLPALGAYCASKAALHYAVESLSKELASTVIKTLLIEPGSFRTELLNPQNRKNVPTKIEDYRVLCETVKSQFASLHHNQPGDPTKGSHRIIDIVKGENDAAGKVWPTSLALGSDAIGTIHKTCEDMLCELGAWETFSASTDI